MQAGSWSGHSSSSRRRFFAERFGRTQLARLRQMPAGEFGRSRPQGGVRFEQAVPRLPVERGGLGVANGGSSLIGFQGSRRDLRPALTVPW